MRERVEKEQYTMFGNFVCLVCFITNLSQTPYLVESALTRYVSIPIWLLFGFVCVVKKPFIYIRNVKNELLLILLFGGYYIVASMFNSNYLKSELPYPIFLCTFVLIVGLMAGQHLGEEELKRIASFYIFSGLIVCVDVYISYIHGQSITGSIYLYSSKNSVSQILLTTWVLILLLKFNNKSFVKKFIYLAFFIFLTWTMLALKSRATLIGMPIVVIWILLHGKTNKKVRNVCIAICAVVVLLMLNNDIYNFVINDIAFGGRNADSLSDLSSGRSDEWATFPEDFSEVWFWGKGREKRESLILTALLEFGIVGGGMILALAISPLIWGVIKIKKGHPLFLLFTSLGMVYFVNGIFEQLAPFGPGVKCYFLWFIFGILAADKQNGIEYKRRYRENKYGKETKSNYVAR